MRTLLPTAAVLLLAAPASAQFRGRAVMPAYRPSPYIGGNPYLTRNPYLNNNPYLNHNPYLNNNPYLNRNPYLERNPYLPGGGIGAYPGVYRPYGLYGYGYGYVPPVAVPTPVVAPTPAPAAPAAKPAGPVTPGPGLFTGDPPAKPFSWFPDDNKPAAHDIHVLLPAADAKVTVNGVALTGTGTDRRLSVDKIKDGQKHEYTVAATWTADGKPVAREKKVHLDGTGHAVADFRE